MYNPEAKESHTSMTVVDCSSRGCVPIPLAPSPKCSPHLRGPASPEVSHALRAPCFWRCTLDSHPPWPSTSSLHQLACVAAILQGPPRGVAHQKESSPSSCRSDPSAEPSSNTGSNTKTSRRTPQHILNDAGERPV